MSTIVLIRHGETDLAGRFCGYSDPRLNAAGERDAIRVAEEISRLDISCIYSSDLRRAAQTARAIAKRTGITVEYLRELREIHFGRWEGLSWNEIETRFADEAHQWLRQFPFQSAPGGETYTDFTTRVETAITPLLRGAPEMRLLSSPIAASCGMCSQNSSALLRRKLRQGPPLTELRSFQPAHNPDARSCHEPAAYSNPGIGRVGL